jgi:hypothetical protein
MNYVDSDMSNSTNTVVYFDWKDGNLYLRLLYLWKDRELDLQNQVWYKLLLANHSVL